MKTSGEISGAAWLTVSAAANALGVSERAIQRRAAKGKIPARKISDKSGDRWLVQIAADTPDANDTTPTTPNVSRMDGRIERESTTLTTPNDAPNVSGATSAVIAHDTFAAALMAEKDARIRDLQSQLDNVNRAFDREQTAHAETRRVLAFNLSNASPRLDQDGVSREATGADSRQPPAHAERGAIVRGDGLAMIRAGFRRLFGAR